MGSRSRGVRREEQDGQPVTAGIVRKCFDLPQAAIDRAREALGTTSETETVLRALEAASDLAAFRQSTDAALAELIGRGGFEDRFTSPGEKA